MLNLSLNQSMKSSFTTTPHKGKSKTPNGKGLNKSGSAKSAKTPVLDRFISQRANFEMSHYLMNSYKEDESGNNADNLNDTGVNKKDASGYSRSITETVLGVPDLSDVRVLSFAQKPKCPPEVFIYLRYHMALQTFIHGA